MIHEILAVGPLQCNCSIVGDETTREAIVIDPGDDDVRVRGQPDEDLVIHARRLPASPRSAATQRSHLPTTAPGGA